MADSCQGMVACAGCRRPQELPWWRGHQKGSSPQDHRGASWEKPWSWAADWSSLASKSSAAPMTVTRCNLVVAVCMDAKPCRRADDGLGERLAPSGGAAEPRHDIHLEFTQHQTVRRLPSVFCRDVADRIGKRNKLLERQALRRVMAQTGNVAARTNPALVSWAPWWLMPSVTYFSQSRQYGAMYPYKLGCHGWKGVAGS